MTISIEIIGVEKFVSEMNRIADIGPTLQSVLRSRAQSVFMESQLLCPVDTGLLRRSGEIVERFGNTEPSVEISYSAPYAVYVHEDLSKRHNPPTSAKFLEIAMAHQEADFIADMLGAVSSHIEGGSAAGGRFTSWMNHVWGGFNEGLSG